jgi:hypothetical protein
MAILDQGMDPAGDEIDSRQQGYGAKRNYENSKIQWLRNRAPQCLRRR